jgi:Ca-activated chloride channel family protein
VRVAAVTALGWGLATLLQLEPKSHTFGADAKSDPKHLVLVLDVSPSMRLTDAGMKRDKSRMQRSAELLNSMLERVPVEQYLVTIVACYNGAKPVVIDSKDADVVQNIISDLPMQYAFRTGRTDLFSGLLEAARIAHPWPPKSATLLMLSDGDTVPPTGMPRMPASIEHVLVVGVGDSRTGRFIDGRQSRQDASMLRQIAVRLDGIYHDGNEHQVRTDTLLEISTFKSKSRLLRLSKREYALAACGLGASAYALLPLLLHFAGTRWKPGVVRGA